MHCVLFESSNIKDTFGKHNGFSDLFFFVYLENSIKQKVPVLGCDGELCPVAIGKSADCTPNANTAEQKAWCEHAWVPHFASYGVSIPCSKDDGYMFMKLIGAAEVVGYVLLWVRGYERVGSGILMAIMIGALHFHYMFLGDTLDKLGLQITLLALSSFVFWSSKVASSKPKQK